MGKGSPRMWGRLRRKVECAKQTQFIDFGLGIVQNKANCPKRGTEAVSTVGPVTRRKNFNRGAAEMW